jgi:hypothetical protein
MMILDIVQIRLPETRQKMRRKSSAAKVSISLCEALIPNYVGLASEEGRQSNSCRIVPR